MARRRKAKKETVAQKVTRIATSPPPRKQTKGEIIATLVIFSILCVIVISVIAKINSAITDFKNRPVRTTEVATTEIERTIPKIETSTTETEIITTETETLTTETEIETDPQPVILHFIVNTDSGCIHIDPHCTAAEAIGPDHRQEIDIAENDLPTYAGKFWACGKCSRKYSSDLPKFEN